jgi:hypothetical protein
MKGWYCIYECAKNQWLYDGIMWVNDRDLQQMSIGAKHAIQISQSYNYNPNLPQIEIIDTQTTSVLCEGGNTIDPHQIMKFETMLEAEEFLMKMFTSTYGSFFSIRKIYF